MSASSRASASLFSRGRFCNIQFFDNSFTLVISSTSPTLPKHIVCSLNIGYNKKVLVNVGDITQDVFCVRILTLKLWELRVNISWLHFVAIVVIFITIITDKIRKTSEAIIFINVQQLGSHWTNFDEISHFENRT